jgi:hypothetical protein
MAKGEISSVTFRLSSAKAWQAMWGSVTGAGFLLAILVIGDILPTNPIDRIGLAVVALLFIWSVTKEFEKGQSDRSPQLVFDSEGLTAPGLFGRKLPWAAITGFEVVEPSEGTALILTVPDANRFEPSRASSDNDIAVLVGSDRFRLEIGALDGTRADVEAAFQRFAPHLRKG